MGEIITGRLTRGNVITCSPVVDRGCRLMKDYLSISLVGWRDYEEVKETYVNWSDVMDWFVGSHSLFRWLVCDFGYSNGASRIEISGDTIEFTKYDEKEGKNKSKDDTLQLRMYGSGDALTASGTACPAFHLPGHGSQGGIGVVIQMSTQILSIQHNANM